MTAAERALVERTAHRVADALTAAADAALYEMMRALHDFRELRGGVVTAAQADDFERAIARAANLLGGDGHAGEGVQFPWQISSGGAAPQLN